MKKKLFLPFFLIFCVLEVSVKCSYADYYVTEYWTSETGWGEPITVFSSESEAVYINVSASGWNDPSIALSFRWYKPNGEREYNLGTNLIVHYVYGPSGGLWGKMLINGFSRELGRWRVEHWGWSPNYSEPQHIFTAYFNIEQAPLNANFSATPKNGQVPLIVNFTDQSTGTVDSWSWDFGDGSSSTEQNPNHIYNDYGIYTVSLTITGSVGSDTETKIDYINVRERKAMPWIPLLLLDD